MVAVVSERLTDGIMAKKKAEPAGFNPRSAGFQSLTVSSILQMIEDCRDELAEMENSLGLASGELSLESIEMEGATKLARALELIEAFGVNLVVGIKKTHRKTRSN